MLNNFSISERKVAIIGAGFVGASIAYALTIRKLAREIVLIDIHEEKTIGEALDIQHGIPDMGISSVKAGNYEDCKDCDLIIITAGRNRKPGETRLDLIAGNSAILKNVVDQMKPHYTKGVIMIVSNPVDVLVYQCTKWMGTRFFRCRRKSGKRRIPVSSWNYGRGMMKFPLYSREKEIIGPVT